MIDYDDKKWDTYEANLYNDCVDYLLPASETDQGSSCTMGTS